ncbi:methyltransferase domain-containing protein [Lutibacter sp.]
MESKIKIYKTRGDYACEMLDKYYPISPNKIISDIGAGYGHMQTKVSELGAKWQPFDYVKKMEWSIIWDLNNPAPNTAENAGLAIFLEVLEHLPNPLLSLKNISSHIEKGGFIILTTPNPQSSKNIINLFLKGTLYAFQEKHLKEYHVFTPWEHIVKHFLKECGFEIIDYAIVDTTYCTRKISSFKDGVKYLFEKILERKNIKSKGMSYGIVVKKI